MQSKTPTRTSSFCKENIFVMQIRQWVNVMSKNEDRTSSMGPEMKNLHSIPDLYTIISLSSNRTSAVKKKWCKRVTFREWSYERQRVAGRRTFGLCRHSLGLLKQSSLVCNLLWLLTTIIILGKQTITIGIQDDERFDERNKHLQESKTANQQNYSAIKHA